MDVSAINHDRYPCGFTDEASSIAWNLRCTNWMIGVVENLVGALAH
jgi:hypothetical protein